MRKIIGFSLSLLTALALLFGPAWEVSAQVKQHTAVLTWTASTTANVKYNICRSTTAGGPYTVIAPGVAATTFTDNTGVGGTKYFYVVDAVDSLGFSSVDSNEVSTTFLANPAPATGLGVVAQ